MSAEEMRKTIDLLKLDSRSNLFEARPPSRSDIQHRQNMQDIRQGRGLTPLFVALGYNRSDAEELAVESYNNIGDSAHLRELLNTLAQIGILAQKYGMNAVAQQVQSHDMGIWYDQLTKHDWDELEARQAQMPDGGGEDIADWLDSQNISDLDNVDRILGHRSVASTISAVTDKLGDPDELVHDFFSLATNNVGADDDDNYVGIMYSDHDSELLSAYRKLYEILFNTRPKVRGRDY